MTSPAAATKPLRINVLDPKDVLTPAQRQTRNVAEIRQQLQRQFPRMRRDAYCRDDDDPLAGNATADDGLAAALDALDVAK